MFLRLRIAFVSTLVLVAGCDIGADDEATS